MRKEQLVESIRQRDPLMAEAVDGMIDYVTEKYPAAYPSRKQTEAVNAYLKSVHADGNGSMSEQAHRFNEDYAELHPGTRPCGA